DNLIFRTNSAYTNTDQLAQTFASGVLQEALGQGQATVSNITQQNWLIENTIEYRNTFSDDHDLTLLGGFTAEGTERFNSSSVGLGFSTEVNNFNSLQQAENQTVSSGFRDENLASFLGRINYSYMDKYLLTLSFRADGSSKFAAENKWASFPSAALSWRISEEDFLRESNVISDLRVRASYGITGSQAINPYQSLASLSTIANAYTFGDDIDAVGVGAGRVPNPSLKWETTEQANIGLELGLFESRINLTADVYDKTTKDLLFSRQLPWYSGYSSQTDNIGSMRNRGVELGLNTINTTGNFMWTTSANLSLNRNEILDLGPDGLDVFENAIGNLGSGWSQEHILREGEPMGSFYGYIFDGIYQNQEEVNAIEHTGASAGSVKLKDLNDDDRITEEDRTIIGDPNPDFIYSLTNEFSYRGFDLNIMVQGSYGNDILNIQKKRLDLIDDEYTDQNLLTSSNDYWRGEGTSNTLQAPGTGRGVVESRYVEDGSYLRLKNVLLGYNLPSNLVNKMGLQSL
ncbi:MAG: SusC/RagA family TonB-linked outer membrane protein, partial [Balneolales bacterium]